MALIMFFLFVSLYRWSSPAVGSWTSWSTSPAWCPPMKGPGSRTTWTTPPRSSSSESSGTLTSLMWSLRTERWVLVPRQEHDWTWTSFLSHIFDHSIFLQRVLSYCVGSGLPALCNRVSFLCSPCCYLGATGKFSHVTFVLAVFLKGMFANLVKCHTGKE